MTCPDQFWDKKYNAEVFLNFRAAGRFAQSASTVIFSAKSGFFSKIVFNKLHPSRLMDK